MAQPQIKGLPAWMLMNNQPQVDEQTLMASLTGGVPYLDEMAQDVSKVAPG